MHARTPNLLALKTGEPADKPASPAQAITVRDLRFVRESKPPRWWLGGDPVATAWFNALSGTFPRGEAYFIEAVKAHRDGVPPKLNEEIRAFIVQEVNHTREHLAFNRIAAEADTTWRGSTGMSKR